ncbi:hypothetical protein OOZ15_05370 [Galbibacter sp. EGI 63066]|uniref:WapI family immunity protein n=1 Tax=Galbibacter sp. EGI 63066 TaxID=2993559 RepID=UPI002248C130|nr:hypothetical protein [Galbibacter sp. EGI 63066]MCX2679366.1 hypothetical protein [Galbibacter sp. EGI 63066]
MLSIRDKNKHFRLGILGYEFLDSDILEDLNWLNIEVYASDKNYQWKANGAYLTSTDLSKLYSWLSDIEKSREVDDRISFLEHELSFSYDKRNLKLSINLDFNLHPKGKNYDYTKDVEYQMKFELYDVNIHKVLKSLKKMIDDYPIRYSSNDNKIIN